MSGYCVRVLRRQHRLKACSRGPNFSVMGILISSSMQIVLQLVQLADILGARFDKRVASVALVATESAASCLGILALLSISSL